MPPAKQPYYNAQGLGPSSYPSDYGAAAATSGPHGYGAYVLPQSSGPATPTSGSSGANKGDPQNDNVSINMGSSGAHANGPGPHQQQEQQQQDQQEKGLPGVTSPTGYMNQWYLNRYLQAAKSPPPAQMQQQKHASAEQAASKARARSTSGGPSYATMAAKPPAPGVTGVEPGPDGEPLHTVDIS